MSQILQSRYSSNPEDHAPIIRQKKTNLYRHDGGPEWSVGCICGFYDGGSERWFIPAQPSAERLYKEHLRQAGVLVPDEVQSDEDESTPPVDMEVIEQVIATVLTQLLQSLCNGLVEERTAFTTVKKVLMELEQECQT